MNPSAGLAAIAAVAGLASAAAAAETRPNVVVLMTDDTGWGDTGCYGGGAALGHPTPNIDRMCREGAVFTSWYGQASCTAGRASFITGRIPIRSALSVVVGPGDENRLRKQTPTIAEFFRKAGYRTYFSGKWHLGDRPDAYPIEHGFDEMKHFAAYYAGVYAYDDLALHPYFPSFNPGFAKFYESHMNLGEWEGVAGRPATMVGRLTYASLADFDVRQTDSAVQYIREHAHDGRPFFMDVNFLKMHNPTNPAPGFKGKSHLGNYSDALLELDADTGRILDALREAGIAGDTIVVWTADNGAWTDAYPDAGTTPWRGEKGTVFEGGWRVPGIMWWPGHVPAGVRYDEMMSHIDLWATLAAMAGLHPPPHEWTGNDHKPIYFDSIDNSAYVLGKAKHSARKSWIYIAGERLLAFRADVDGGPDDPAQHFAWKYVYTAKDSWLGVTADLGAIGALYNLTMDPFEKYDMVFNGAAAARVLTSSPGRWSGQDNGWASALLGPVLLAFDQSILRFPSLRRAAGGASNDMLPNLQEPANPLPAVKGQLPAIGAGFSD